MAAIEIKDNIPMVKHGFPYQKLCSSAMDKLGYDKENYFSFMSDTEIKYLVDAHDDFIYEYTRLFALCELSIGDVQIEEIKGSEKLNKLIANRYRVEFVQAMGGISPIAFKTLLQIAKNIKFYKIFMFTIAGAFVIVYLYRMLIGDGNVVVFEPQNNIVFRIIRKLNL